MKYISTIILCVGLLIHATPAHANCDANYPKLDKALISLWHSSKTQDHAGASTALDLIDREWNLIVPDLYKYLNPTVNIQEFNKDMDYCIISMKISLYERDYHDLSRFAYRMLTEFKFLRDHHRGLQSEAYPIDNLLTLIEIYNDIDATVNDQMFGLKYWFEFADMVDKLKLKWDTYDKLNHTQITACFPFISKGDHLLAKSKVKDCLSYFLASLESGYRTDFAMPCDELGGALSELLVLYADQERLEVSLQN